MSSEPIPHIILTHFKWSLARLKEAIQNENTEYHRGAALERFRLTYNVALETIRAFASEQGKFCSTDKSCFEWVREKKWLDKNSNWNNLVVDYKKIQTMQKNDETEKTYGDLQDHYLLLDHLSQSMTSKKD